MEERYKDISLEKLKLIPLSREFEFVTKTTHGYKAYSYESKNIGWFNSLEEAKGALDKYIETESEVIAYEIKGPEHGYGESDLNIEWDNISNDDEDNIASDESPEFNFIFDTNKNLISSYFYDEDKPGGERLEGEKFFNKGEFVYVRDSISLGESDYDLLIPVEIEGKVTPEYLKNKWRNVIKERDKKILGENTVEEPSEGRIQREIDSLLNIEKDSIIFKPLITVKCNWGEEPITPFDDAPRNEILQLEIIMNKI